MKICSKDYLRKEKMLSSAIQNFNLIPVKYEKNSNQVNSSVKLHSQPVKDTITFSGGIQPQEVFTLLGQKFVRNQEYPNILLSTQTILMSEGSRIVHNFRETKKALINDLRNYQPEQFKPYITRIIVNKDMLEADMNIVDHNDSLRLSEFGKNAEFLGQIKKELNNDKNRVLIQVGTYPIRLGASPLFTDDNRVGQEMKKYIMETYSKGIPSVLEHNNSTYVVNPCNSGYNRGQEFYGIQITEAKKI